MRGGDRLSVAALVALLGFLGAFQIHILDWTPAPTIKYVIVTTMAFLAAGLFVRGRLNVRVEKIVGIRSSLNALAAARRDARSSNYRYLSKALVADIFPASEIARGRFGPQGDVRRHAHLTWNVAVENVGKRALGQIDFPLLGEIRIDEGDVGPKAYDPQGRRLHASLVRRDGYAPLVRIDLPMPALAPGHTVRLSYEYTWPGVAHLRSDHWTVDLSNVLVGGQVSILLDYPNDTTQAALARRVSRRWGVLRLEAIGSASLMPSSGGARFEVVYTKAKGDRMLVVSTAEQDPADA